MNLADAFQWMLENRNIEHPCPRCAGFGVISYGNTSTWRGGVGGQQITSGVCDECWGTGDKYRIGISHRKIEKWKKAYDSRNEKK